MRFAIYVFLTINLLATSFLFIEVRDLSGAMDLDRVGRRDYVGALNEARQSDREVLARLKDIESILSKIDPESIDSAPSLRRTDHVDLPRGTGDEGKSDKSSNQPLLSKLREMNRDARVGYLVDAFGDKKLHSDLNGLRRSELVGLIGDPHSSVRGDDRLWTYYKCEQGTLYFLWLDSKASEVAQLRVDPK